ncbi:hypothetical protein ACFV2H_21840 [Streptomyces sp. NPDC059629]|uniref:MmyB family transcriptional regulator n=1 Tax=Streptomyces sp. NPDC059629 TaxID=3346889 RepID=UPI0036B4F6AE
MRDAERHGPSVVRDYQATGPSRSMKRPVPAPAELVAELVEGNAEFVRLWASGTVAAHREDHKTVRHPEAGPVEVDCDVLTDGDSEFKIVILSAAPGSVAEARLRTLVRPATG